MGFNKKFTLDSSVYRGDNTAEITIKRQTPYYLNLLVGFYRFFYVL